MRNVHKLLDLGCPIEPADYLVPGSLVVVRSGPLAGMTGKIVRAAGETKFVVRVDLIERGVAVVVDAKTLGKKLG